jgi:cyclophilin family peptidyl-prolyl cis-trans isomerase
MSSQRRRQRQIPPKPGSGSAPRPKGRRPAEPPPRSPMPVAAAVVVGAVVLVLAGVFVFKPFGIGATPSPSRAPVGENCPTSQPPPLAAGETRTVTIDTPKGTIVIKVDGSLSPIAAGNFVALASCGFYDGVVFHRVVTGFVIQGGDPEGTGGGGPGYTIADEPITATYKRGTVAMARTTDAHSQGSQFFIVLSDDAASSLTNVDPSRGYAIFGTVTGGMDVVDAIAADADGELPSNPIPMTSVTVTSP